MKKVLYITLFSCIVFTLSVISGCSKKKSEKQIPPRPVQIGTSIQKDVPIYIDTFGTMTAINSVNIQSQVKGQIEKVHFKEGDDVKQGDVLFTIDKSMYQAQLDQAKAAIAEDLVNLKLSKDTLTRNRNLFESKLLSQQDFEQFQTNVAAAEAQLLVDEASAEMASINLGYCSITSPVDGVTGKRLVDPGNIVQADTGPTLVNIKTLDPLYIDFPVTEQAFPRIKKAMSSDQLTVNVLPDEPYEVTHTGTLNFIDNTVDEGTGTISLRATIENKDRMLWPGMFVNVRLILGIDKNATLVPYDAVQIGKQGMYLFVVTSDNKADLRIVTVGQREGDDIIISKGVKPGEKVVTVGQMGLSPGASVVEVTAAASAKKQASGIQKPQTKTQESYKTEKNKK